MTNLKKEIEEILIPGQMRIMTSVEVDRLLTLITKEREETIAMCINNRPAGYLTRDLRERHAIEHQLDVWQKRLSAILQSLTRKDE